MARSSSRTTAAPMTPWCSPTPRHVVWATRTTAIFFLFFRLHEGYGLVMGAGAPPRRRHDRSRSHARAASLVRQPRAHDARTPMVPASRGVHARGWPIHRHGILRHRGPITCGEARAELSGWGFFLPASPLLAAPDMGIGLRPPGIERLVRRDHPRLPDDLHRARDEVSAVGAGLLLSRVREWATADFRSDYGAHGRSGATPSVLGFQTIWSSFFVSILSIRRR